MFDFFDSLEKKRAFKKALEEVREENKEQSKTGVSRVYSNQSVEKVPNQTRYTGPFNKPSSSVVDLKHFKDWRKVEKVQSNNPVYDANMFKSSLTKNEPEKEEPKPESKPEPKPAPSSSKVVEPVFKSSPVSKYVSSASDEDRNSYGDFDDFFTKSTKIVEPEKKVATNKFSDDDEKKKKSTFARMFEDIEKKRKANEAKKPIVPPVTKEEIKEEEEAEEDFILARKKPEQEQKKPEIKVQVVQDKPTLRAEPRENNEQPKVSVSATPNANTIDTKIHTVPATAPAKPVAPAVKPAVKKTINRKPRGKNKRRFDADVIGSVDWR